MSKNTLKIAWLFPDILFLHGERGNLLALKRIAAAADVETEIVKIDYNSSDFNAEEFDIIVCPPGEMVSFTKVIEWLKPHKDSLKRFIESGKVLFVTGTSQCIFGKETHREDGSVFEGLGLIDCTYKERKYVYGDDIHFIADYGTEKTECFGVQIQMMDVFSNEKPFGQLLYGFGNTGKDRNEGVVKHNSVFTNVLGPALVLNPWLTKQIITNACKAKGIEELHFELDTVIEQQSLETKKHYISKKKTNLTNCK